jgi:hypothetical protein
MAQPVSCTSLPVSKSKWTISCSWRFRFFFSGPPRRLGPFPLLCRSHHRLFGTHVHVLSPLCEEEAADPQDEQQDQCGCKPDGDAAPDVSFVLNTPDYFIWFCVHA